MLRGILKKLCRTYMTIWPFFLFMDANMSIIFSSQGENF